MKKSTLLLATSILGLFTSGCNQDQNPPTPSGSSTFKYEVISSRNWNGAYVASDGGTVQVQNKPSGWTYSGSPKQKPFTAHLFVQNFPIDSPTNFVLHIYYNDEIVAADTIVTDRFYNNAVLSYVIH